MSNFGIFEVYRCAALGLPVERHPGDNQQEWRRCYDALAASDTPTHPDCPGGEVEYVNGPLALLPRPVDSMLERYAAENIRFAELSRDGCLPTPEEAAAHVAAINNIRTGR